MASAAWPLEAVVRCLNGLKERGLIGEHAIGGAMALIYWAEPQVAGRSTPRACIPSCSGTGWSNDGGRSRRCTMSIWDEPLTKEEYLRRLFAAKAEQHRKAAELPFEEKVAIVLALQGVSRALRNARAVERAGDRSPSEPEQPD